MRFKFTETHHDLTGFPQKSRELFPDATVEVVSLMESKHQAIAEWTLAATQTVPFGPVSYRIPVSLFGTTSSTEELCKGRTTTTTPHLGGSAWFHCSRRPHDHQEYEPNYELWRGLIRECEQHQQCFGVNSGAGTAAVMQGRVVLPGDDDYAQTRQI